MDSVFFANIFSSVQSTGVFVIVLSVLILVHEWGHFITAKRLGVIVDKFSLGFGPKLFSKVYKGTEYLLCLIPLGGYVKMAGDERAESTGAQGEFLSKPPGQRALIALNGPVVNYIFAYVCLVLVFWLGYPDTPSKIQEVLADYPAKEAGLLAGDEIIKVDGHDIYGWTELKNSISESKSEKIELTVVRQGDKFVKTISPKVTRLRNIFGQYREIRTIGITPYSTKIGMLDPKGPAKAAGLEVGDNVFKIDSTAVNGWSQLQKAIEESENDEIKISFLREGKEKIISVIPKLEEVKIEGGKKKIRMVGISPAEEIVEYKFSFKYAVVKGYQKLIEITVLTYKALYFMATGSMNAKESMTGPIGIFYFVKSAAETGLSQVLFVLGLISASLAIFNLLPVIPLDGGHLFLLGVEKIRGKKLSEKVEDFIMRTGFSLIIMLALFVFYSDFSRFGWIDGIKNFFN